MLCFKYWPKIILRSKCCFQQILVLIMFLKNPCSGLKVLLNERLSGLEGGEGDFIILQGEKRHVPFRIRRDQIIGDILDLFWLLEKDLVGLNLFLGLRTRWAFSRRGTRPLSPWRQRYQRCCSIRTRPEILPHDENMAVLAFSSTLWWVCLIQNESRWSQSWTCCKVRRVGWYKTKRWVLDLLIYLAFAFVTWDQNWNINQEEIG